MIDQNDAGGWARCFSLLKRFGFQPSRILDIGANRGHWTRAAVEFFPAANFILVEPQERLRASIDDLVGRGLSIKWLTLGASDARGTCPLTLTPDEVSSSFLPTAAQAAGLGFPQTAVPLKTVDEIVAAEWGVAPDMVKIDAEGYDLKVLNGCAQLFGRTDIFFVEAAICATGIENTLAEVVRRMASVGYKVIEITDMNRSPKHGVLWLCELVFMRESCPLFDQIRSYQ